MLKLKTVARPAAALAAAVLLVTAFACGDDDDGSSPTPPGSPDASSTASPDASGVPSSRQVSARDAQFTFNGGAEGDLFTGSHSLALGDFNDDGELDLLAGAPQQDGPDGRRFDGGAAYVAFGPLEGVRGAADADVTIYGSFAGDGLGYAALAGDLNGDGVDDVLVGAPGVTAGFDPRTDQGRVYVFWGGAGFGSEPILDLETDVYDFTVTGSEGFSRMSNAMAMGDIDGDGTDDLVIGSPFAGREPGTPPGGPRTTLGEVYVIYGGDDLSGEWNIARDEYDVLISGKEAQGQFGGALAVTDFNEDGNDDIAIAAHRSSANAERLQSGAVYIFHGGNDLPRRMSTQDGDEDGVILGPAASAAFGFPLAGGDFDGDGVPDLAAGAQLDQPDGLLSAGSVRVISGESLSGELDLATEQADITIPGSRPGQLLPSSLAAAALDEGPAALAIGNMLIDTGDELSAGFVYVTTQGLDGDSTLAGFGTTVNGAAADDRLGNAVTLAVTDSGAAVAMLAPGAGGASGNNTGAVYVVFLGE